MYPVYKNTGTGNRGGEMPVVKWDECQLGDDVKAEIAKQLGLESKNSEFCQLFFDRLTGGERIELLHWA